MLRYAPEDSGEILRVGSLTATIDSCQQQAGLVTTKKIGRVRTCQLGPRRLEEETVWLERYRRRWDERFDELDQVVEELTRKEKSDERRKRE